MESQLFYKIISLAINPLNTIIQIQTVDFLRVLTNNSKGREECTIHTMSLFLKFCLFDFQKIYIAGKLIKNKENSLYDQFLVGCLEESGN